MSHGGSGILHIALTSLFAVGTGVVVIVVAIAVVLLVLLVTVSMRGRQKRGADRRDATRRDLDEAHERAGRAERDRDAAQERVEHRPGPDRTRRKGPPFKVREIADNSMAQHRSALPA